MTASSSRHHPEPEPPFGEDPPQPPAPPGLPDLSAWGRTAPPPPPVPEHVFEPGDDVGNRLSAPDPNLRPKQGPRRGGERRGGPRRRFGGGERRQGAPPRRFEGLPRDEEAPRRPHIPGAPPPPADLPGNPRVIPRQDHSVSRKQIDPNAVQVLYRLHRSGYKAYLVGGGVRDLLLGLGPKDFDVATDARPNEIKKLFGNCFIIGRRFRLCHVRFGRQVIEVATFRGKGAPVEVDEAKPDHGQTPLDENVFGTPQEDALRRDITINGLFYDIGTFALIDYVGGMEDLKARLIRTIGDPAERFREDPVRMVRAVKFAARLGFAIEPATRAAVTACRDTLASANPSRMLEEWYRLLHRGHAAGSLALLQETGLLEQALPSLARDLSDPAKAPRVQAWLGALDALDPSFRPLPNALCLAGLFGPRIEEVMAANAAKPEEDLGQLVWSLLEPDLMRLQVSRRDRNILVRMVLSQKHFEGGALPSPGDHFPGRDYFPAALDFFELRSRAQASDLSTLPAWRQAEREVPRRPLAEVSLGPDAPAGTEPARRRRRRRRGGRRREEAQAPAGAKPAHDPENGPPPEVIDQLYPQDQDDVPGWVEEQP